MDYLLIWLLCVGSTTLISAGMIIIVNLTTKKEQAPKLISGLEEDLEALQDRVDKLEDQVDKLTFNVSASKGNDGADLLG